MSEVNESGVSYASFVGEGQVHSAIFTDESIFEAELDRIFYRYWVYLAHESEIPEVGDYCTKWIGRQQIIVARGSDSVIRAFFNRCRHRGTTVCRYSSGNAKFFRCSYHGWTYNNDGRLVGVPFPSRYGEDFNREELGLAQVPHLDEYRGFIFTCLSDEVPTLPEHLGRTTEYLDRFLGASPAEKIGLRAGSAKSVFRGNWKFVGMDGYHVNFTHRTVAQLQSRRRGYEDAVRNGNTDRSPNLTVDLGNGHCRLDLSHTDKVEVGREMGSLIGEIPDTAEGHRYMEAMLQASGSPAAALERIRRSRDVHLHVWPNLQLVGSEVRVIRPVAAGVTEVTGYPALLSDVPDRINEGRLRAYEWFNGAAGFGSPDDREVFERNQVGLSSQQEPWIVLKRGLGRAETMDDGLVVGNITDEVTQRSQMRKWAEAMG